MHTRVRVRIRFIVEISNGRSAPASSGSSDTDDEKQASPRRRRSWRPVDPEIWARQGPPPTGLRRLAWMLRRVLSIFTHPMSAVLLAPVAIGWSVVLTLLLSFYIGGVSFFGLVFLTVWGMIAAGAGLRVRKKPATGETSRDGTFRSKER